MTHPYWQDTEHARWRDHYAYGRRGHILCFTKGFRDGHMPPDMREGGTLRVVLYDQADGKTYDTNMVVAYEHEDMLPSVMDQDWDLVRVGGCLQDYFYAWHHCPCHRKQDARSAGAQADSECEGARFLIQSVTTLDMPELILYSETLTADELEDKLLALK